MNAKALFFIKKYKSVLWYLFFGVCTTLINILFYALCTRGIGLGTVISTCIAWLFSVVFAYFTNRTWVFSSAAVGLRNIGKEVFSFFLCRVSTGVLDVILMFAFVNWFGVNDMVMKFISNVLVIILNYVASKLFVFKMTDESL